VDPISLLPPVVAGLLGVAAGSLAETVTAWATPDLPDSAPGQDPAPPAAQVTQPDSATPASEHTATPATEDTADRSTADHGDEPAAAPPPPDAPPPQAPPDSGPPAAPSTPASGDGGDRPKARPNLGTVPKAPARSPASGSFPTMRRASATRRPWERRRPVVDGVRIWLNGGGAIPPGPPPGPSPSHRYSPAPSYPGRSLPPLHTTNPSWLPGTAQPAAPHPASTINALASSTPANADVPTVAAPATGRPPTTQTPSRDDARHVEVEAAAASSQHTDHKPDPVDDPGHETDRPSDLADASASSSTPGISGRTTPPVSPAADDGDTPDPTDVHPSSSRPSADAADAAASRSPDHPQPPSDVGSSRRHPNRQAAGAPSPPPTDDQSGQPPGARPQPAKPLKTTSATPPPPIDDEPAQPSAGEGSSEQDPEAVAAAAASPVPADDPSGEPPAADPEPSEQSEAAAGTTPPPPPADREPARRRRWRLPDRWRMGVVLGVVWSLLAGQLTADYPLAIPGYFTLAFACVVLSAIDLRIQLLPDRITYPAFASTILLLGGAALIMGEPDRLTRSLVAALAAGILFVLLARFAGMGLGDVKLAPTLAAALGWLSWSAVASGMIYAFMLAGLAAAVAMVILGWDRKAGLPLGPWLAAGTLLAILTSQT
jgi:leader peptidase (prepilin peptidase) / N-methyltransferase